MPDHEEDRQDVRLAKDIEQRLELSAAWRELLGLDAPAPALDAAGDPAGSVAPVLKNDPWAALLQVQGIQMIDLQQVHTLPAQHASGDDDVELALNNIQEQEP
jgi:hypothetical protein